MIEKLTKQSKPRIVWRRQTRIRRDIRNEVIKGTPPPVDILGAWCLVCRRHCCRIVVGLIDDQVTNETRLGIKHHSVVL